MRKKRKRKKEKKERKRKKCIEKASKEKMQEIIINKPFKKKTTDAT